jgi:HPt (histidine-containing phosphotransfer) domain-containing protein
MSGFIHQEMQTGKPMQLLSSNEQIQLSHSAVFDEAHQTLDAIQRPIFDREGFLERLMGNVEIAQTVVRIFLDDIPKQIESLKCSLETSDIATIELLAHSIKGAAANVGGEALRNLAFEIEKATKAHNLGVVKSRMDDLNKEFELLKQAMKDAWPY